jgi:hypothetical protein
MPLSPMTTSPFWRHRLKRL